MKKEKIIQYLQRHRESVVYLFCWLTVFVSPLLVMSLRSRSDGEALPWHFLGNIWWAVGVFLVFFLVHNFFVAPLFFFRRKRRYILFASLLVVAFGLFQYFTHPLVGPPPPRRPPYRELRVRKHRGQEERMIAVKPREPRRLMPIERVDLASLLLLVMVFGLNLGVKIYYRSEDTGRQLLLLRQESLAKQLEYLKAQINPHFFMNTLNNIHALVDIDPERAKTSIILLSQLMRYVLYEGDNAFVPLRQEVDFLSHYIELMRLRYTERVRLEVELPEQARGEVPPLLFIMFLENAFKHGVSYRRESRIHIALTTTGDTLRFVCDNTKASDEPKEHGGVGLRNVRKRLDLIYGNRYQLRIGDEADQYTVELTLPLKVGENRL